MRGAHKKTHGALTERSSTNTQSSQILALWVEETSAERERWISRIFLLCDSFANAHANTKRPIAYIERGASANILYSKPYKQIKQHKKAFGWLVLMVIGHTHSCIQISNHTNKCQRAKWIVICLCDFYSFLSDSCFTREFKTVLIYQIIQFQAWLCTIGWLIGQSKLQTQSTSGWRHQQPCYQIFPFDFSWSFFFKSSMIVFAEVEYQKYYLGFYNNVDDLKFK